MRRIVLAALGVGAALAIGLAAFRPDAEDLAALPPGDPVAGGEIYAAECAACHGADLEGARNWRERGANGLYPAPPHDASGHTWHHDDALLFDYTKLGGAGAMAARGMTGAESGMPAFGNRLSDSQIRDVLTYIKSTWPEEVRAAQARRNGG